MTEKLARLELDVNENREEIINKMVQFSLTDVLLFWGKSKDLMAAQEKEWKPLLLWAEQELNTKLMSTHDLDVPEQNKQSGYRLKILLESLSNKELAAFYVAALNTRSPLLALALVKGRISAEEAFSASFLEELWQAKQWGNDEDAEQRRKDMKKELLEVEKFLKK